MKGVESPIQRHDLLEPVGVSGIVTLAIYAVESDEADAIDRELGSLTGAPRERYLDLLDRLIQAGGFKREIILKNLVVTSGRSVLARLLAGDDTYSGAVNYGALGTGSTAPAAGDTTLGTEVARKLFANRQRSGTSATIDFYYSKADTNGTYEEFGCFIDGTATADSGQLYNRVLTGGWTKTSLEAMTVSIQIDVNAS